MTSDAARLLRSAAAECVGTAFLLAAVIGSGIAGISPVSAPAFVAAQRAGALLAVGTVRLIYPGIQAVAGESVLPRGD